MTRDELIERRMRGLALLGEWTLRYEELARQLTALRSDIAAIDKMLTLFTDNGHGNNANGLSSSHAVPGGETGPERGVAAPD